MADAETIKPDSDQSLLKTLTLVAKHTFEDKNIAFLICFISITAYLTDHYPPLCQDSFRL